MNTATTDAGRGRGRPSTGVRITVRIPADTLAKIDEFAARWRSTRAEVIRDAVAQFVEAESP